MQMKLLYKLSTIAILFLLLQIPLGMVESLINERTNFRNEARSNIAQSWTGTQNVIGPILVAPYLETATHQIWDESLKAHRNEVKTERKHLYLLPDNLTLNGKVQIEERRRGLYTVPVYTIDLNMKGGFSTQSIVDLMQNNANLALEPAYLTVLVSDLRGIAEQPRISWQISAESKSRDIEFRSGSKAFPSTIGMHVIVGELDSKNIQTPNFSTHLILRGMEAINSSAVAKDTIVTLSSAWQHPSFTGYYLPREHTINDSGFTATWKASSFSSDMEGLVKNCSEGQCTRLLMNNFGVSFITPIDIYQQSERSVKYGILFIGLTFIAFFLFEVIKKLRLHAMHYSLVGLALATFYLLLISFSEHIGFSFSYLLATISCTFLLAFYISGIMRDWRLGLAFAGKFLALYGMLYVILQSEDNALLMGSILIFVVLMLIMTVTRNLDWYKVGEQIENITTTL
jgi:inner membrane protein